MENSIASTWPKSLAEADTVPFSLEPSDLSSEEMGLTLKAYLYENARGTYPSLRHPVKDVQHQGSTCGDSPEDPSMLKQCCGEPDGGRVHT